MQSVRKTGSGGAPYSLLARAVRWVGFVALLASAALVRGGSGGGISGTVSDPSGAMIAGAKVTATETETGVAHVVFTDTRGFYAFPVLPVGNYDVRVERANFKAYRRAGVAMDADGKVTVDAALALGAKTEQVSVSEIEATLRTSQTPLGEVIAGSKIAALPLNGRSYTDLLALQPGIAPATSIRPTDAANVGGISFAPSGDLNAGNLSINGQRAFANGFTVNGADVEERRNMGAAIVPSLDSIAEFRVSTGDLDAESGGYSGGSIAVVTKSGANRLHGGGSGFFRNTNLDSRSFFSPSRGAYRQEQLGANAGGAIAPNRAFFFADYQATRNRQGVNTGVVQVPSAQSRAGNLADLAAQLTGTVNGQYWANQLTQKLGHAVSPGEKYYFAGCADPSACVLPNATIPMSAWSPIAKNLLPYIPEPNAGRGGFATSAYDETVRDDKGAFRLDAGTRLGMLSAYYFMDDYSLANPYPTAQVGASVPGFSARNLGRSQMAAIGLTRTFGAAGVNDFHFSYVRDANLLGQPVGGLGRTLASQGFVTGAGTPGIVALSPNLEGVENIAFNSFTIGETTASVAQAENTFEWTDKFFRTAGAHQLGFGATLRYNQINAGRDVQNNGSFSITGAETGSDFADFLLGIASSYTQGQTQNFYNRNRYAAFFAQDSWRVKRGLTVNYGLRWEGIMPWYEKYNQVQTLVPGAQSRVFPGAPTGLVFPGDLGIPATLAPTRWNDVSPRFGLSYAPHFNSGILRDAFGEPDSSSIHVGFGRYFTAVEGYSAGVMAANAPYGMTYTSPAPPLLATPFVSAATGENQGQRFPFAFAPLNTSLANPGTSVDWAQFEPITGVPGYVPSNRTPYTVQYDVSIQREIGRRTLLKVAYVGSQAHHLLVLAQANPGNPALCLALGQPGRVKAGSAVCGPFGEDATYVSASGQVFQGTRAPYGHAFGSNTYQAAMGNSNFNALEVTARRSGKRVEFLAAYTYGKSLDGSSSLAEQVNPFNYRLLRAPSSFDLKHNLTVSYRLNLPLEKLFRGGSRFAEDWTLSGVARLSTGFPVTLSNSADTSLLGTVPDGVNGYGVDEPNFNGGALGLNRNPRNGRPFFNPGAFSHPPLGQAGNADRRSFYGPGLANFDLALSKRVWGGEASGVLFRLEAFNAFNHAQFFGAGAVNGEILSASFGRVVNCMPPRLVQLALKYAF